jgi:hypothetical protein
MPPCAKTITDKCDKQQIVGGSEHTLRAKLTFSQESHGRIYHFPLICLNLNILVDAPSKLNFLCFNFLLI